MAKTFREYAAERQQRASDQEKNAVRAFDAGYARYSVGAALALARKSRRLNQTQLADRAGMDQGDISRIERGQVAPTMPTLLKLIAALDGELTLDLPSEAADDADRVVLHLA
jgi:ribosome-binding protein aMBF1 (putative translation factor)